jgi:hypothetical protein
MLDFPYDECETTYIYTHTHTYTRKFVQQAVNSYLPPYDFMLAEVIVMGRPNPVFEICITGKMPPFHIPIHPWEQKSRKE